MNDNVDWSNPATVIALFFGLILTGLVFMVKLLPAVLGFGVLGTLGTLFTGGFVWFSIFTEK